MLLGGLGVLGRMRMLGTAVDLQLAVYRAAKTIVRDHTLYGALDQEFRAAFAALAEGLGLVASDETGETHVALLGLLLASDLYFRSIDHNNEITCVNMRGEDALVLAAKQIGGLDGNMTEVLVLGIDYPPLAFYFGGFSGKSLHSDLGKGGKH